MFEDLAEQFGKVFADKQMQVLVNTCNFHIGVAPNGKVCYDVNGANPQMVAEGFRRFQEALKKVKMIE